MSPTRPHREFVEMADHRVFFSDDGWATVWQRGVGRNRRLLDKQEADLVRFLAVSQSSASADWKRKTK